jgi:hypothetical protein
MRIIILLTLIILTAGCESSQSAEYKKKVAVITGSNWEYDQDAIQEAVKGLPMSNMELNVMRGALRRLTGAIFVFNPDGTMELRLAATTQKGTWKLSPDGKAFEMLLVGSSSQPNIVEEISEGRIVLAAEKQRGMIFPKIFRPVPEEEGEK